MEYIRSQSWVAMHIQNQLKTFFFFFFFILFPGPASVYLSSILISSQAWSWHGAEPGPGSGLQGVPGGSGKGLGRAPELHHTLQVLHHDGDLLWHHWPAGAIAVKEAQHSATLAFSMEWHATGMQQVCTANLQQLVRFNQFKAKLRHFKFSLQVVLKVETSGDELV